MRTCYCVNVIYFGTYYSDWPWVLVYCVWRRLKKPLLVTYLNVALNYMLGFQGLLISAFITNSPPGPVTFRLKQLEVNFQTLLESLFEFNMPSQLLALPLCSNFIGDSVLLWNGTVRSIYNFYYFFELFYSKWMFSL